MSPDGGEDHGELRKEFAPAGQGNEGDAQGYEELDDGGRSRAVADAHLIESVGRPRGELPDGQACGRDDLTEVRTFGGEAETAPEETGADQGHFDGADDRRDGGTQVQPEAEEDDRGNRRGRHADNVTRGAGVSPPARALRDADAASHGAIAAVSLHVLRVVLNLIVASDLSPAAPATSHTHGMPPPLVQHQVRDGAVAAEVEQYWW